MRLLRHLPTDARPGEFNGRRDVDIHASWRKPPYPHDEAMKKTILSLRQSPPARIFSSPLKRARLTTDLVFAEASLKAEIIIDPLLSEIDFGQWEGLTWEEITHQYPVESQLWLETWQKYSPPGGETLDQVVLRVKRFVSHQAPTNNDLVVCHGGIIKVFLALESSSLDSLKTHIAHHSIYDVDIHRLNLDCQLL